MRSAAEAAWTGSAAYGRQESAWFRIGRGIRAVGRMIVPVVTLLLSFAAVYLYLDTPATPVVGSVDSHWLTMGYLLVPVSFLCVHLTNRRYGPAYAFAQVVLALAASVAFVVFVAPDLRAFVPVRSVPDIRVAAAFGGAFFVASFISIIVFDGARGPRWWMAPLLAMLASVVIFGLVFYPAAGMADWPHRMSVHLEFLAALAVLSLVPYWFLRGLVRPLPGFNGY
jgi:uncharacterized PurR-regulated membrane protein YhhQ (DUF165 family)